MIGHTKASCYRLIVYPPNFNFKKKTGQSNGPYEKEGESQNHAHNVRDEKSQPHNDGAQA